MRSLRALYGFSILLTACPAPTSATSATDSGDDSTTGASSEPTAGSTGDDPTGGDTEHSVDPVDLACDLMHEACERQVACGHAIVNNNPGGVDACLAEQRCETVGELLDLPNVELDPDAVAACIAALEAASCGELVARGLEIDPGCSQYLAGTLGEGEACRGGTVSDCAPGLSCVSEDGACPGTCVAQPAPCSEGSCGADAFCTFDGTCEPRAALGEACDEAKIEFDNLSDRACAAGSHCEDSVCVADLGVGAPCGGLDVHACGDGACVCADLDNCHDPAAFACGPAPGAGEPCSTAFDCTEGLYCDFDAGGRCAARGGPGEACNDSFGACLHSLACVDGTCLDEQESVSDVPLLAESESCLGGGSCPLGTACTCDDADCLDKHCAPAPGLGESCAAQDLDGHACSEGLCDILASHTCVLPGAAGEACPVDGLTFACASLVCIAGHCASAEQTLCQE
ncbi:hypothetical protein [Nannocystis pusilla]|uniref:hypothetical protein n=1 Tax=Nannocystis pusilla TaxID=889268 RepID=UPI003B7E3128